MARGAIKEPGTEKKTANKESRTTRLKNIVRSHPEIPLYVTPDGEAWLGLPGKDGVLVHMPVLDDRFKGWLLLRYHEQYDDDLPLQTLNAAITFFDAYVQERGGVKHVFTRVAPDADGTGGWLDLGPNAVHYSPAGWQVHSKEEKDAQGEFIAPFFRRAPGFLALPEPIRNDQSLDTLLKPFLNPGTGERGLENWRRMVAWLLGTLMPYGAYPLLILNGEAGSGKSTICEFLRTVTDRTVAETNRVPPSEKAVQVLASQVWVVGYDNLQRLPTWLSDVLCGISTGSGSTERKYYTNNTPVVYKSRRPTFLNGIDDIVVHKDLQSRCLFVVLPTIPGDCGSGHTKSEMQASFDALHPYILGALLDVICAALARLSVVRASEHAQFRLGDLYELVTAAEPALGWEPGTTGRMLKRCEVDAGVRAKNNNVAVSVLLEYALSKQPDADGVVRLKHLQMLDLYTELGTFAREHGIDTRGSVTGWPQSPAYFSQTLNKERKTLKMIGFSLDTYEAEHHRRFVDLEFKPGQNSDIYDTWESGGTSPAPCFYRYDLPQLPIAPGAEADAGGGGARNPTFLLEKEKERHIEKVPGFWTQPSEQHPPSATGGSDSWRAAYRLLPMCPNPQHLHGHLGYCPTSKLPIDNSEKLPDIPLVFQFNAAGMVTGVEIPDGVEHKHFPHLLDAATKLALEKHLPIDGTLHTRLLELDQRRIHEQVKLACPHTTVTTVHTRRSIKPICQACGAEVYPDGTVL